MWVVRLSDKQLEVVRAVLRSEEHRGPALEGALEALDLARWDDLPEAQLPWGEVQSEAVKQGVLTEGQAERLFRAAFDGWLQARLEDPPEGIRRSLRRTSLSARRSTCRRSNAHRQQSWTRAQTSSVSAC